MTFLGINYTGIGQGIGNAAKKTGKAIGTAASATGNALLSAGTAVGNGIKKVSTQENGDKLMKLGMLSMGTGVMLDAFNRQSYGYGMGMGYGGFGCGSSIFGCGSFGGYGMGMGMGMGMMYPGGNALAGAMFTSGLQNMYNSGNQSSDGQTGTTSTLDGAGNPYTDSFQRILDNCIASHENKKGEAFDNSTKSMSEGTDTPVKVANSTDADKYSADIKNNANAIYNYIDSKYGTQDGKISKEDWAKFMESKGGAGNSFEGLSRGNKDGITRDDIAAMLYTMDQSKTGKIDGVIDMNDFAASIKDMQDGKQDNNFFKIFNQYFKA